MGRKAARRNLFRLSDSGITFHQGTGTTSAGPASRILPVAVSLNSRVGPPGEKLVKSSPRGLNMPEILPTIEPSPFTTSMSVLVTDTNRSPVYRPHPGGANAICRNPDCPVLSGIVVNGLTLPALSTEMIPDPCASDTSNVPPTAPKPEGARAAPNGVVIEDRVASLPTAPLGVMKSTDPAFLAGPWFVTRTSPLNDPKLGARTGCVQIAFFSCV